MTQDGRWKLKYNEVMSFMEKEYRKLSKYYPKEKLMFHFIHHNRKLYNVGTMKEERKVLFEKLLVLCEKLRIFCVKPKAESTILLSNATNSVKIK